MKAIVTIKLPRNPKHNPRNKKSGWCPINPQKHCTDITGSHHSYIQEGLNMEDIRNKARAKYDHITRIEFFDEDEFSDSTWAYILGLLEARLKEVKNDIIARQIRTEILKRHPRLKRMLEL